MTIGDFVQQNDGRYLDFDGYYGPQCVDLVQFWAQANGLPTFSGNAKDIAGQTHDVWEWEPNTPAGVPPPGSVIVWAATADNGWAGHTGVSIQGSPDGFTSFDQNYPTGTPAHKQSHDYTNVLGWLRLPSGSGAMAQDQTSQIVDLRNMLTATQRQVEEGRVREADLWSRLGGTQAEVERLRSVITMSGSTAPPAKNQLTTSDVDYLVKLAARLK